MENIYNVELGGLEPEEHPYYYSAHVNSAMWIDTGRLLTDEELWHLNENEDVGAYVLEQIEFGILED